jgi:hypothetical protein
MREPELLDETRDEDRVQRRRVVDELGERLPERTGAFFT